MSAAATGPAPAVPLLRVRELSVSYCARAQIRAVRLRALDRIGFDLAAAQALGVVGESGSGKSTLARTLLRLIDADGGSIRWHGQELLSLHGASLRRVRAGLQMIFQDGLAALDPRQRIGAALEEPLQELRPELAPAMRRELMLAMLQRVGLEPEHLQRYPHQFSGGQAQRIGIARALLVGPELLICDEPLSSLDVSIKAQITALLLQLKRELGLSLLFIAHDLPAVELLCDRVLVLYLGRVVELGPRQAVFGHPRHPYTRALLQAVPIPDPQLARRRRAAPLTGEPPSALSPPSGCVFRTRCPYAIDRCARETPGLRMLGEREVACHRAEEI